MKMIGSASLSAVFVLLALMLPASSFAQDDEPGEQADLRAKAADTPKGKELKKALDECEAKVQAAKNSPDSCEEELFDYVHYIDSEISKELFKKVK
ncbi:cytochrome b-c1 complex subunit 6 family protein [Stenotrophomonas sp.]|uniref:cytochrome b-c1 complex subunit 6 family protein n=1 Tax=Stenotrophomonas sp. TaxID=69392 RepID=UPI0028ABD661|nr:cytochrome b-c1 complex subunit 6 family protein [Stenotrophomonas sp.]